MSLQRVAIVHLEQDAPIDLRAWLDVSLGSAILRSQGLSLSVPLVKSHRQAKALIANWIHHDARPGLIFIPVAKGQVDAARSLIKDIAALDPGDDRPPIIAVGGIMGTLAVQEFSSLDGVRAIILGEWFEPLDDLVTTIRSGGDRSKIPGVWWLSPEGWKLPQRKRPAHTFPDMPEPDLSVFRVLDLLKVTGNRLPILASRGYPFRSLFSAAPLLRPLQERESYYETLPPLEVVRRAAALAQTYRPAQFDFVDEIFPWDARWIRDFAEAWATDVTLPFTMTSASEHLTEDNLRLLAGAGLKRVRLQFESGNDQFRERFADLNLTNATAREAVRRTQKHRVMVEARFLLGLPDETPETLAETTTFAESLQADRIAAETYIPWPRLTLWSETEPAPTIITQYLCRAATERPELIAPLRQAEERLHELAGQALLGKVQRNRDAILDAAADIQLAAVTSPHRRGAQLAVFRTQEGDFPVVAMRVPARASWKVRLAANTHIQFGIALEPVLPGLRTHQPVSFSVLIGQKGRYLRLFQKVLIQALDPDSRRWHWFSLPTRPAVHGDAEVVLEALIFGKGPDFVPADESIIAGWAHVLVGAGLPASHDQIRGDIAGDV